MTGHSMRQIKFRAWDKENEDMTYYPEMFFDFKTGNLLNLRHAEWEGDCEPENYTPAVDGYLDAEQFKLMQFTGLHDIANEEIWEGDVIEWFNLLVGDGKQTGKLVREEVKFDAEGLYRIHCLKSNHNIKVLGNIYENGDLLK